MDIRHTPEKKRFDLYDETGERVGEIEYMPGGNNEIYATHTEVFSPHEGKGYAGKLLAAMAEWAEREGKVIIPICPYVIAAFKKHPDKYAAVMKK